MSGGWSSQAADRPEITPLDYQAVLNDVAQRIARALRAACTLWLLSDDGARLQTAAAAHPDPDALARLQKRLGIARPPASQPLATRILRSGRTVALAKVPPAEVRLLADPDTGLFPGMSRIRTAILVALRTEHRILGILAAARETGGRALTAKDQGLLEEQAARAALAVYTARLQADNLRRLETLTSLYASTSKLSHSLNLQELARDIARTCVDVFGATLAWVGRAEPDRSIRVVTHHPLHIGYPLQLQLRWGETPEGEGVSARAIRTGFPQIVRTAQLPAGDVLRERLVEGGFQSVGAFPLITRNRAFGNLDLYSDQPDFFSPDRVELFQAYAHQAAAALENARLISEAERRLEYLSSLHAVDVAVAGSLDLRAILTVIIDQVITHLRVDAADVLLMNPHGQTLEFAAGQGFRTHALRHTVLRVGQGYAGRAAMERRTISVPNLKEEPDEFARSPLLPQEEFVAYRAVPLIAKGQVKGVLEVFHRVPFPTDPDWLSFLESIAGQAAIAIDNAELFENLQRANASLIEAYDATLEGWVRALDLRDHETEGHTQRVTVLTLRLARAMGVPEEELVHIRRGALLHDIGKMAISDSIVLKPGPLSVEEWAIMHQHPNYARELLWPIPYLRPALEIPYCHHERWDGTGYPRRLRGEEIPLPARIFTIVDVWDALRSDRPYRRALPSEEALRYIKEQAGRQFDPQVVEAFVRLLEEAVGADAGAAVGAVDERR